MRRRASLTSIVVLAVAGIAIAATVDGLRGDTASTGVDSTTTDSTDREGERLSGPEVPVPGALAGQLVFAGEDCRLRTVSFSTVRLSGPGPPTGCEVWASPTGRLALVSDRSGDGSAPVRPIALVRLDGEKREARPIGTAVGDPSWSPDGTAVAWCGDEGEPFSTAIASFPDGGRESIAGCFPRFTPEGTLLLRPALEFASELWEDGEVVLTEADLLRGFPDDSVGTIELLGYDRSADGVLAVTAVRVPPDGPGVSVLQLWDDGELTASVRLPGRSGANGSRFGELVRFSPDGTQFAVAPSGGREDGPVTFVDLRLRRPTFELASQRGFSWSPDGAWLAVAVGDEIAIYSRESSEIVYRLAVPAWSVNWVKEPGA